MPQLRFDAPKLKKKKNTAKHILVSKTSVETSQSYSSGTSLWYTYLQLNIIQGKWSKRKNGENVKKKTSSWTSRKNQSCPASKPLSALGRLGKCSSTQGCEWQHWPIHIPQPFLSLVFFLPSQKGPAPGLQMKQLQHLVKSVLLLLENIHARNISYSQCTSERAANKDGKQKTLPDFLIIISQVPPFITHNLLKRVERQY